MDIIDQMKVDNEKNNSIIYNNFWEEIPQKIEKFKCNTQNIFNNCEDHLSNKKDYLTLIQLLSSLQQFSEKIKTSEKFSDLNKVEYSDIDNLIEYLMDGKIQVIRYKMTSSSENQNLFKNSSRMIERVSDNALNILQSIDRAEFALNGEGLISAYYDTPLSIGWNTTISAPHMHLTTLNYISKYVDYRKKYSKAIDIGSGSGYMSLALAKLLGPNSEVYALDHINDIVEFSKNNIKKSHRNYLDYNRIKFVCADGRNGYLAGAPYEIIHVGAACENIPDSMIEQLAPGGLIWIPVGPINRTKKIILLLKEDNNNIKRMTLMDVNYSEMKSIDEQLNNALPIVSHHSSDDDSF
jgi:protein-L-isoaspartate(D-aspartate) O-methyltransferase